MAGPAREAALVGAAGTAEIESHLALVAAEDAEGVPASRQTKTKSILPQHVKVPRRRNFKFPWSVRRPSSSKQVERLFFAILLSSLRPPARTHASQITRIKPVFSEKPPRVQAARRLKLCGLRSTRCILNEWQGVELVSCCTARLLRLPLGRSLLPLILLAILLRVCSPSLSFRLTDHQLGRQLGCCICCFCSSNKKPVRESKTPSQGKRKEKIWSRRAPFS